MNIAQQAEKQVKANAYLDALYELPFDLQVEQLRLVNAASVRSGLLPCFSEDDLVSISYNGLRWFLSDNE